VTGTASASETAVPEAPSNGVSLNTPSQRFLYSPTTANWWHPRLPIVSCDSTPSTAFSLNPLLALVFPINHQNNRRTTQYIVSSPTLTFISMISVFQSGQICFSEVLPVSFLWYMYVSGTGFRLCLWQGVAQPSTFLFFIDASQENPLQCSR